MLFLSLLTLVTHATCPNPLLQAIVFFVGVEVTFHPDVLEALVAQFPPFPQLLGTVQPFSFFALYQAYHVQFPSPESVALPLELLSQHG